VKVNGKTLFEFVEPEGVKGPRKRATARSRCKPDPKSVVRYKNVMVKRLPDSKP